MILKTLPHVLQQHTDALIVLTRQRRKLLTVGDAFLTDLAALDHQIGAHLEGLRHAHATGWEIASKGFRDIPDASSVVAPAYLSAVDKSTVRWPVVFAEVRQAPKLAQSAAFGLSWHGVDYCSRLAESFLASDDIIQHLIGLELCLIIGHSPLARLQNLCIGAPEVRALAIDAITLGQHTVALPTLATFSDDDDIQTCAARYRAIAQLSDPKSWPPGVLNVMAKDGIEDEALIATVAIRATAELWTQCIEPRSTAGFSLAQISGIGLRGDPAAIKSLVDLIVTSPDSPEAGTALRRLTGIEIDRVRNETGSPPTVDPFGLSAGTTERTEQELLLNATTEQQGMNGPLVQGQTFHSQTATKILRNAPLPDRPFIQLRACIELGLPCMPSCSAPMPIQR